MTTETISLIAEIALLVLSAAAFIYGVARFFRKKKPLFAQIAVCAAGSLTMGQLFIVATLLCAGSMPERLNLGLLGTFGCFFFLFSASYGQMDGLVDSGEKDVLKFRVIPLTMIIPVAVAYTVILLSPAKTSVKVAYCIICAVISAAMYFNFKHLIIPDVETGLIRTIRTYNACALVLGAAQLTLLCGRAYAIPAVTISALAVSSLALAAMIPLMERGVKKWFK